MTCRILGLSVLWGAFIKLWPREEKQSSVEISAYLSLLVHLGRAKPKNLPRGRNVRYESKKPLFSVSSRVV